MTENSNQYPLIQLNLNIRSSQGEVIEQSVLANVRGNDPDRCLELYELLKQRISHGIKEKEMGNNNLVEKLLEGNPQRCPECDGKLVKRLCKNGRNAGAFFMGCENFKKGCRVTMPA